MFEIIYRYDPSHPLETKRPTTSVEAQGWLESGNDAFAHLSSAGSRGQRAEQLAAAARSARPGVGWRRAGAHAGTVRRGAGMRRRPGAAGDHLPTRHERHLRGARGRKRAGRRVPGQHGVRRPPPSQPEAGGRAGTQRVRRCHRHRGRVPRPCRLHADRRHAVAARNHRQAVRDGPRRIDQPGWRARRGGGSSARLPRGVDRPGDRGERDGYVIDAPARARRRPQRPRRGLGSVRLEFPASRRVAGRRGRR